MDKRILIRLFSLDQKINLTGIIENADENRVKIQRIEMDLFEESLERIKEWFVPIVYMLDINMDWPVILAFARIKISFTLIT